MQVHVPNRGRSTLERLLQTGGIMADQAQQSDVVIDRGKWEWSELYKKEDWWAIWLGFAILIAGLIIFVPRPPADMHEKLASSEAIMTQEAAQAPFNTIEWHMANDAKSGLRARNEPYAKTIANWLQRLVAGQQVPWSPCT
jgi:hypothetical protein